MRLKPLFVNRSAVSTTPQFVLKVKTSVLDAMDEALGEFEVPKTLVEQEYRLSICHAMNPYMSIKKATVLIHCDDGMFDGEDKAEAQLLANRRVRLGMALYRSWLV